MKKLIILIVGAVMTVSCGTAGSGAFNGAMLGGIVGSSIGGISGGYRGSDIGTLVGMATGAVAGGMIGAANEAERNRAYYAASSNAGYGGGRTAEYYDPSGRTEQPVNDDVINLEPSSVDIQSIGTPKYDTAVRIENARFINADNTQHIAKGELVKVAFEVRNVSGEPLSNIVPMVQETTGNKRILISPSTMIESLGAHKAIRYTAFVSAQKNLKTGSAHFKLSVMAGGAVVSNIIEFDVPLN